MIWLCDLFAGFGLICLIFVCRLWFDCFGVVLLTLCLLVDVVGWYMFKLLFT